MSGIFASEAQKWEAVKNLDIIPGIWAYWCQPQKTDLRIRKSEHF